MPSAARGERADDAERDADPLDRLRPEAGQHVQREPRQPQRRVARAVGARARARRRPRPRVAPLERTSAFVNFCRPIAPSIGSIALAAVGVERAAEVGDRRRRVKRRSMPLISRDGSVRPHESRRATRRPLATSTPASTAASSLGMSSGWFWRSPSIVTIDRAARAREPGVHRRVLAEVALEPDGADARVAVVQRARARAKVPSVEPSSTKIELEVRELASSAASVRR